MAIDGGLGLALCSRCWTWGPELNWHGLGLTRLQFSLLLFLPFELARFSCCCCCGPTNRCDFVGFTPIPAHGSEVESLCRVFPNVKAAITPCSGFRRTYSELPTLLRHNPTSQPPLLTPIFALLPLHPPLHITQPLPPHLRPTNQPVSHLQSVPLSPHA